jgi:hypothetical protein
MDAASFLQPAWYGLALFIHLLKPVRLRVAYLSRKDHDAASRPKDVPLGFHASASQTQPALRECAGRRSQSVQRPPAQDECLVIDFMDRHDTRSSENADPGDLATACT